MGETGRRRRRLLGEAVQLAWIYAVIALWVALLRYAHLPTPALLAISYAVLGAGAIVRRRAERRGSAPSRFRRRLGLDERVPVNQWAVAAVVVPLLAAVPLGADGRWPAFGGALVAVLVGWVVFRIISVRWPSEPVPRRLGGPSHPPRPGADSCRCDEVGELWGEEADRYAAVHLLRGGPAPDGTQQLWCLHTGRWWTVEQEPGPAGAPVTHLRHRAPVTAA